MIFDFMSRLNCSASESGVGPNGMEFATIARAFAHAKVPTVVASLWRAHDAATSNLMQLVYKHLESDADNFSALAAAQREMLKVNDDSSNPAAWAAFTVFGKP